MINFGPLTPQQAPEVVKVIPSPSVQITRPKEGIYTVRWPAFIKIVEKPKTWYQIWPFHRPKTQKIEVASQTKRYYFNGLTGIYCYPKLVEVTFGSRRYNEIEKAIERHFLREKFNLPHPFNEAEESYQPGNHIVKTSEYR